MSAVPGPRWRAHASVLGLFLVLAVLLFHRAWSSPGTTWIGGPGDPPLFMWYLRWMPWAIGHGVNPLFTDHMNFPDGVNLMWNTTMPLPSLLLSPLTLSIGPLATYNVLMTVAVALNGFVTHLVLLRLGVSRAAAVAGASLFAFSPYVVAHATAHPNLPTAFLLPVLALLVAHVLVEQRRPPLAVGAVLGVVAWAQLLSSEELLASAVLTSAVAVMVLATLFRDRVRAHGPYALRALVAAAVVGLTLAAVPLAFQFLGPQRVTHGALWGPDIFVSDAWTFVVPTGHQQLEPDSARQITSRFTDACCPAEWNGYVGLPLAALLVGTAVVLWRRRLVRAVSVVAVVMALLSMGPHLHVRGTVTSLPLPFALIEPVPVLKNLLAGRLMLYVYLAGAVLVALAFDELARHHRALAAGTVALALLPLLPTFDFPATRTTTPRFFTSSDVERIPAGSVALVAPFARDTSTSEPMLWQARAGLRYRMPSGYALGPDHTGRFVYLPIPTLLSTTMEGIQRGGPPPALDAATRKGLWADLARAEVATVLVGPMAHRLTMVAFLRELLGRDPVEAGGVYVWSEVRSPSGALLSG